jgi:putative flippase GtrA
MQFVFRAVRAIAVRYPTVRQLLKFCIVGTINTGVDFSAYIFMTRAFDYWGERLVAAGVISYCCGMISSFALNNFWTFRRDRDGLAQRAPKFLLVTFSGLAWNALIFYALISFGSYDLLAKAVATICVIAWNFTLYKKWAFNR